MTPGSVDKIPPILVIGIGNPLLSDDGAGLRLLEEIKPIYADDEMIEFIDGGTQGIMLIGRFAGRKVLIFLDAITMGGSPGTIHTLDREALLSLRSHESTTHESGAAGIIKTALLTDDLPDTVYAIGIEPKTLKTDIGLSQVVTESLPKAVHSFKMLIGDISTNSI